MNIPLDNLYHWIQGLAQHPVILYVFRPHGSKDIFDLDEFEPKPFFYDPSLIPSVICHDQEPLDFSIHQFDNNFNRVEQLLKKRGIVDDVDVHFFNTLYSNLPLLSKFKLTWLNTGMCNDWTILLHSEKNSSDVEKFSKSNFFPVYYWSHAMIARDWYRFAENDTRVDQQHIEKTFLIYCRDWTPTREYRLKFLDLLVSADLQHDSTISTQHINNQGVHLKDYQIQDPRFATNTERLLCISDNTSLPSASADYNAKDIITTAVSVVLETVVDGSKIHLTEKILRPIACAHPFVLLAGPGSLRYLQEYGFQTFGDIWDESYDQETDTVKRMEMIVKTMQQIQQLSDSDWAEVSKIVEHNRRHFFSQKFIKQVRDELQKNLNHAIDFCMIHRGETFWRVRKLIRYLRLPLSKSQETINSIQELRKHRSTRFNNVTVPIIGQ